mmetsp:Transcript_589/g.595  ORF Transcript_589/g.595 Transcript_589/m.595 type:complete len:241 (+) Transcript_589:102-824(+)
MRCWSWSWASWFMASLREVEGLGECSRWRVECVREVVDSGEEKKSESGVGGLVAGEDGEESRRLERLGVFRAGLWECSGDDWFWEWSRLRMVAEVTLGTLFFLRDLSMIRRFSCSRRLIFSSSSSSSNRSNPCPCPCPLSECWLFCRDCCCLDSDLDFFFLVLFLRSETSVEMLRGEIRPFPFELEGGLPLGCSRGFCRASRSAASLAALASDSSGGGLALALLLALVLLLVLLPRVVWG